MLILALVILLPQVSASVVLIQNPSPVPLGGTAEFVCNATSSGLFWMHNTTNTSELSVTSPATSIILLVPAIPANNNTNITCRTAEGNSSSAELYIYGPPSKPSSLTSLPPSAGVLMLSWSPPWTPDGVQLHYIVTLTDTNSSAVQNYTTHNTTIDINSESDARECDEYMWSVSAVNSAGSGHPASNNETISFVPDIGILNVTISTNNKSSLLITIEIKPDNNTVYAVELTNVCSNYSEMLTPNESLTVYISDPQNWTNITVVASNSCYSRTIAVNTSSMSLCTIASIDDTHTAVSTSTHKTITIVPDVLNTEALIVPSSTVFNTAVTTTAFTTTTHNSDLETSSTPTITVSRAPPPSNTNNTAVWLYAIDGVLLVLLLAVISTTCVLIMCRECRKNTNKMSKQKKSQPENSELNNPSYDICSHQMICEEIAIATDENAAYGVCQSLASAEPLLGGDEPGESSNIYEEIDGLVATTNFIPATDTLPAVPTDTLPAVPSTL